MGESSNKRIATIKSPYLYRIPSPCFEPRPRSAHDGKIDRLTDDVQDLKHRVTSLEGQVASIRGDMAAMSLRIDRIETRLDLVPAPTS